MKLQFFFFAKGEAYSIHYIKKKKGRGEKEMERDRAHSRTHNSYLIT